MKKVLLVLFALSMTACGSEIGDKLSCTWCGGDIFPHTRTHGAIVSKYETDYRQIVDYTGTYHPWCAKMVQMEER